MRAIEFRGKREDTGRWVHGSYAEDSDGKHIINNTDLSQGQRGEWFKIDPETVGEYTGLKDKNGVNIFEGDIVRYMENTYDDPDIYMGDVVFKNGCFMVNFPLSLECLEDYDFEVIGNIHDNPELLKEGE